MKISTALSYADGFRGGQALDAGWAKRDPALGPLQITAGGVLAIGEGSDVIAQRQRSRPTIALYVGGMGAKGASTYHEVMCRYGNEREQVLPAPTGDQREIDLIEKVKTLAEQGT